MIYYHRILPFKGYDIDLGMFEWQLSFIKRHFDVLDAEGVAEFLSGGRLKRASVAITFDDGFFDNYVYAYPLLKKYGLNAILFVPTAFINSNAVRRKTLEDYWNGKVEYSRLDIPSRNEDGLYRALKGDRGEFLSWEEIREMVDSGVFHVGSHSHLHVKYFSSDHVIGIKGYTKTHWSFLAATSGDERDGLPVFPMRSSVACRRFIPFKECMEISFSMYNSGADEKSIIEAIRGLKKGRFEFPEEAEVRIENELRTSREIIAGELGYGAYMLSWPWGEYDEIGIKAARKCGFSFCFSTDKSVIVDNVCAIGRLKAPSDKFSFIRKIFANRYYPMAKIYSMWHGK